MAKKSAFYICFVLKNHLMNVLNITLFYRKSRWNPKIHYKNTPIQIYWKFYLQKTENFQIKISDIFIFLLKT